MTTATQSIEERMEELSSRVAALEAQLRQLARPDTAAPAAALDTPRKAAVQSHEEPADVSEEVLGWAGRTALLPRLATLCFLLVLALILRTVTDNGLVDKLIGSGLGMTYAAALMVTGWHRYRSKSPLAPVFAVCGAALMSAIVVETHTHFMSLPLVPAYFTLMATGFGMAFISRQFSTFVPISAGVLGMCLAGAAIDYPHPFFPYLSMVLLTANLLGAYAGSLKRCSWLRWTVLLVSIVMLQLWAIRIGTALRQGNAPQPELAADWFVPVLSIFAAALLGVALFGILRGSRDKITRFDLLLPTLNVIWSFSAVLYVGSAKGETSARLMGTAGVIIAISHLAVSFWLARRHEAGGVGAGSFTLACGALLALALPAASGKLVLSLPAIAIVGIFMAVMSRIWENGEVRIITYLFQAYCSVALALALLGDTSDRLDALNILPAGLLALIILYQYQWCRWKPPLPGYAFFTRFDPGDRSATALLLGGLVCGFFMLRVTLFQTIQLFNLPVARDSFRCGQSVLINLAAIGLILLAFRRKDKELRNAAILVTMVGAVKVFLNDLLGTHGLPLVFSIFSFGMAAAIESVALGKWPRQDAAEMAPPVEA